MQVLKASIEGADDADTGKEFQRHTADGKKEPL